LRRDAISFGGIDLFVTAPRTNARKIACVLVDEAQFLTPQVLQLTLICDRLKSRPCYGFGLIFAASRLKEQIPAGLGRGIDRNQNVCHTGKRPMMNARLDAAASGCCKATKSMSACIRALSRAEFDLPASPSATNPTGIIPRRARC
jgi:hypothetical protein